MKLTFCLLSLGFAVGVARAQLSSEAMLNYVPTTPSGGSPVYSYVLASINGPVGWTFQPDTGIDVTALGAFDYVVPSGGVEVGLWDSSGDLLASETITSGSTAVGQSLYESITPVDLTAGQTYYLGAYSASGPLQAIVVTPDTAPNGYATMSPGIQLGEAAYRENSGFAFPATTDGGSGYAIVAPNFEFETVPEPSILCLLGGGLLLVAARYRVK